ncbi:MAG TPA: DNA-directed RNA polymerase subunit alpha C-terminal domain-containing protein [Longimicrobiales bacterium]|nr:DNA-directed RNA polymerase subunit alpha C-terminal domain-containing protein [Longimicrobiales bacterium]
MLKTCPEGHTFYKTSDCESCPTCDAANKPRDGFLSKLSSPARRALEGAGITTLDALANHTEAEVLALHGMGPKSMPTLREALAEAGKSFRKSK